MAEKQAAQESFADLTTAQLLPLVYQELRGLAGRCLGDQARNHTLQPTALVHEAYLKLLRNADGTWRTRARFLAVATRAMRQVLVDAARARSSAKRGGGWNRVTLSHIPGREGGVDVDLLALDEALSVLERLHERQCRIAELRFIAGLTVEETAHLLNVCEKTVRSDWRMARAWLVERLGI